MWSEKKIPMDLADQRSSHCHSHEGRERFVATNERERISVDRESIGHQVVEIGCYDHVMPRRIRYKQFAR